MRSIVPRMILVFGEALVDIIGQPGQPAVEVAGGGPLTTAVAASRLGAAVTLLCSVSTDVRGQLLREAIAESGVNLVPDRRSSLPTATARAEVDALGHATYTFDLFETALTDIDAADVTAALALRPAAVHVGTLALALPELARAARGLLKAVPADSLVMVDPNCRPAFLDDSADFLPTWHLALERADVVKVSDDDLHYLHGDNLSEGIAALQEISDAIILLTRGADGVDVIDGDLRWHVTAPRVLVADTVGAGDTFSGVFLARCIESGWRRGGEPDMLLDAVAQAAAAAALACTRVGAVPPTRIELSEFIAASSQQ